MYIKSLKIQGFKSYRDETIVDPFSPGLNLLVGRNGSGKSNFFAAIRFVLSDAYASLTREERQALLHDGTAGGATMSAFVEIEFDNEDGRFPTNKPVLLLRRTIGLKKDEYQLDRKSTSKSEVMSMLESAGFSRSNPYYIVPQGRITHLTNQKDSDRLALLKEVAGTKVYEERRAESTKIMEDTNLKREKIDDLLKFINDRLSELEEEKEELKQFQIQDRTRRSLEYTIYQRELKDVGDALDAIEEERRHDIDTSNIKRTEYTTREKEITDLRTTIESHRQRLDELAIEHQQNSAERRDIVKSKAEVECTIKDAEFEGKKGVDRIKKLNSDFKEITNRISAQETELKDLKAELEFVQTKETEAKFELEEFETEQRSLLAKRGRSTQFRTQKDRDEALKREIKERKERIKQTETLIKQYETQLEEAKAQLEVITEARVEVQKELDSRKEGFDSLNAEESEARVKEMEVSEKRKELWKLESKLDSVVKHSLDQLKISENTLYSTMDRDTSKGLRSVKAIAERLGLAGNGYYGPLYELFQVDDRYRTCVEATAGNSLFQIVVDNDDVATRILQVMLKEKSGRITFMPLNRLKPVDVSYPQGRDAIPMIKKLKFEDRFSKAFQQVFGRTIIVESLEVGGAYSRSHNVNAITLEGDKYDRKGALSGGYLDESRSRLEAIRQAKNWKEKYEQESSNLAETKSTLVRLDQQVTQIVSQLQKIDRQRRKMLDERTTIVDRFTALQEEENRLLNRRYQLEKTLKDQQLSLKTFGTEVAAWEKELKTKMTQNLSTAELYRLDELDGHVEAAHDRLGELTQQVKQLAHDKTMAELELNENLRPRREEMRAKIETLDHDGPQQTPVRNIESKKLELTRLEEKLTSVSEKINVIEEDIENLNEQIAANIKKTEGIESQQAEDGRNLQRQKKNVERYLSKRQLLLARKDECNKNIRDLGVLPEEAFLETPHSTEKLVKKLHKINETLKGFSHVNKKAYEQYTSFTKQRDELLERQKELEDSAASITELIDVLDARKDEAIEQTFKEVSRNFEQVFEKLVPAGRGRLMILRREQKGVEDIDVDESEEETTGEVENYTGVAIRVSFNSKTNEGLKIQQLSGGQKALVALAIIFSIQKCDPAPFYLFDEIDANLDADRRTGVAAMINELSESGQYICTTFRPELIPHAQSYFGVVFNNSKISNVKPITADECLTFVEAAENLR